MKSRVQSPESTVKNSPAMMIVFGAITDERLRQRELLRAGRILFNCDSPIVSDERKLRVLVEEVGEAAFEIDQLESRTQGRREKIESYLRRRALLVARLQTELTQVAAVAVAWLEYFETLSGGRGKKSLTRNQPPRARCARQTAAAGKL